MTCIFILSNSDIIKMFYKGGISCHFLQQIQKILKVVISNQSVINIILKAMPWEELVANY